MKLSPMMTQYMEIKESNKDSILFFRLGDFYEMFFEDAKVASRELELTLTGKSCGQEERAPMCGVPFHSAETYIARLVERGYKVAICEQVEDPKLAKGIVKREIVKIVTPGTITAQSMLNEKENNYLVSIYLTDEAMSVSYCDISTGELYTTQKYGINLIEDVINEIVKINGKEIIINETYLDYYDHKIFENIDDIYLSTLNLSYYQEKNCEELLKAQFNLLSLTGFGLEDKKFSIFSLGALFGYLLETQKQNLKQITYCNYYDIDKHMSLDKATIRNLEITETLYDKKVNGSLLGILDNTNTAMGSRKLKQWLRQPLNNQTDINFRLDAVETLINEPLMTNNLKENLKQIYDFERLVGRIASGNANGKDLIALKSSIESLPEIKTLLNDLNSSLLSKINLNIFTLDEVYNLIDNSIENDAPFTIKEGSLIKDNYSKELDELKFSIKDGKIWIASLESKERERTGIKNLKVGFNKVFGYYLEITKSNYDSIPDNYIRKQTLSNCERFITPELKEMENLVLNAETKINDLEYRLFIDIRNQIEKYIKPIQLTSKSIAELDVLCAFADVSNKYGYIKPMVDNSFDLAIEKGRHPVIEQLTGMGMFVANDTVLNTEDKSMLLITGPNMAGKSTYMRQTALIVLMAQCGCYVPCESAKIGVVDRIFTRIGASDNLSQGQSTFFVEMSELAYILNCSKERSLIILDEIGRGTSTYDGLSIAWAVVEYLCNKNKQIRTLFATHYHELTALEDSTYGVKNLNVDVSEEDGNIVFLHKIIEGSASRSYGIHVAKLAGIPNELLNNANQKLMTLENDNISDITYFNTNNDEILSQVNEDKQLTIFDLTVENPIVEKIRKLDLMEVTPAMAIKILEDLKKEI